jgi:hypothetical protein
MIKILALLLCCLSCSTLSTHKEAETSSSSTKEFSPGELILATELLVKIFDGEMPPLTCVPDTEEASLLLRTIRPRMEVVEDDIEAILDQKDHLDKLIGQCRENCTCFFLEGVLREHQVNISSSQKKILYAKKPDNEQSKCLNFIKDTFCQSELYKILDSEKSDFSFEE